MIIGPACCAAVLVDVAVSLVNPPDVEEKQVRIDRSKSAFDTGALGWSGDAAEAEGDSHTKLRLQTLYFKPPYVSVAAPEPLTQKDVKKKKFQFNRQTWVII